MFIFSFIVSNSILISIPSLDRDWGIDSYWIMWSHARSNYEKADPSRYDLRNRWIFEDDPGSTYGEY